MIGRDKNNRKFTVGDMVLVRWEASYFDLEIITHIGKKTQDDYIFNFENLQLDYIFNRVAIEKIPRHTKKREAKIFQLILEGKITDAKF